jgi:drug/metabolite transporter, DME family
MEDQKRMAILYTVAAAVMWSIAGIFIKWINLDAFTILFYRSFFAGILFLILFRGQLRLFNKLTFVTILFYVPLLVAFVTATKLTTAANAIFLQYTAPAIVLLLEPVFLKTKLTRINIWTVIVSIIGMAVFIVDQFSTPDNWLGVMLALSSGFTLAGLIIVQKMNKPEYQPSGIFYGNLAVCLVTLPWMLESPAPSGQEWLFFVILGMGQLGLGYYFFMKGSRHLNAIDSSLISILEPILNPVWVLIGYGEQPGMWSVIGGTIIIAALLLRLYLMRRQSVGG